MAPFVMGFWGVATLAGVIFIHELGHFFAGLLLGAKIWEFGIGFPPRIFAFRWREKIVFSLNAIPFGGFVRFHVNGDLDEKDRRPDALDALLPWKRAIIYLAGPFMNLAVAAAILFALFAGGIRGDLPGNLPPNTVVTERAISIKGIVKGSPADRAGVRLRDEIVQVDGIPVEDASVVIWALQRQEETTFLLRRSDGLHTVTIRPKNESEPLGITVLVPMGVMRMSTGRAAGYAVSETASLAMQTIGGIGMAIVGAVRGQKQDLAGPVGIVMITAGFSAFGAAALMRFIAILFVAVGVFNLLPIPILDGGRAAFLVVEKIRGRPISNKVMRWIQLAFLVPLLGLLVLGTVSDIRRGRASLNPYSLQIEP